MTLMPDSELRRALRHELEAIRGKWGWYLVLGILLMVLGVIAIGAAVFFTLATVVFFGVLLLIAGAAEVIGAFWSRDWSGFFLELLGGIIYLVLGFLFVANPGSSALALTLLLAAFLIVGGIARIVIALTYRFPSWGWVVVSGLITLLLGILIWAQWPVSGLWVIGLFVGIEMIFRGAWWVSLSLGLRSLPRNPRPETPSEASP